MQKREWQKGEILIPNDMIIEKLEQGQVVISTDANFLNGKAHSGDTARSASVSLTTWHWTEQASSPPHAEAKTLLLATEIVLERKWNKVLLFSDGQILCNSLRGAIEPPWEAATITQGILGNLVSFDDWEIDQIEGAGNVGAHKKSADKVDFHWKVLLPVKAPAIQICSIICHCY